MSFLNTFQGKGLELHRLFPADAGLGAPHQAAAGRATAVKLQTYGWQNVFDGLLAFQVFPLYFIPLRLQRYIGRWASM